MKLYIFGAGASKGAIEKLDKKPWIPETKEIFDEAFEEYAKEVFFDLEDLKTLRNESKNQDLESFLTDKWNAIGGITVPWKKKLELRKFAQLTMYIWKLFQALSSKIDSQNNYTVFVNKLKEKHSEEYGIISFNYDTLLDKAIVEAQLGPLNNLAQYFESNYLKPHGSVNWFLKKRDNDSGVSDRNDPDLKHRFDLVNTHFYNGYNFKQEDILILPPHYSHLNNPSSILALIQHQFDYQFFYPLVFLPLTEKMNDLIANFYDEIIKRCESMMRQADEIYIIGYKAKDKIINDVLLHAQPNKPLHVVSWSSADSIMSTITGRFNRITPGKAMNGGFGKFLETF